MPVGCEKCEWGKYSCPSDKGEIKMKNELCKVCSSIDNDPDSCKAPEEQKQACREKIKKDPLYKAIGDFRIQGRKIYDPRTKKEVVSDNPALVMADLAKRGLFKVDWEFDSLFWKKIGELAKHCDSLGIQKCIGCGVELEERIPGIVSGAWKRYDENHNFEGFVCDNCSIAREQGKI